MTVKPFLPADYPESTFQLETYLAKGMTPDQAQGCINNAKRDTVFRNDVYQVAISEAKIYAKGWPAMLELSIKRIDRYPIHDWRDLQTLKNMLVGPEHEAVELYPAESRLMDTANQYYMYAFKDPTDRLPFGFTIRAISTPAEARKFGARQRPFK